MSRRIKTDRRAAVSPHTPIEIVRVKEYPHTPPELVKALIRARDRFWRMSSRLRDECYRDDWNRDGMAIDCYSLGEDIHYLLMELRLIADDSTD